MDNSIANIYCKDWGINEIGSLIVNYADGGQQVFNWGHVRVITHIPEQESITK